MNKRLSVVTSMYRSEAYLREFHARTARAAEAHYDTVEFVYVNDGSPDESLAVSLDLQRTDPRVRVVDLSRNFGHHEAMLTGLAHATGDDVFLIDCDLEEPPEALHVLLAERAEHDADVAFGVQAKRKGRLFERISGGWYYAVVNALWKGRRIPENMCVARVMSRRYVDAMLRYTESEIIFSGIAAATGFRQIPVVIDKRSKGTSTYTLSAKLSLLVRTVTAWSDKPLLCIAYLGAFMLVASTAVIAYYLIVYVTTRSVPVGYTSLAISLWFLGGLIVFCMGIIATYLSVIFVEVKHRPRSIVREVYGERPAFSPGLVDISALPPVDSTRRET